MGTLHVCVCTAVQVNCRLALRTLSMFAAWHLSHDVLNTVQLRNHHQHVRD